MRKINKKDFELYAAITESFCFNNSALKTCEAILRGGGKFIQLREKEYPKVKIFKMAEQMRKLTKKYGAKLIINDYLDIAMAVKADGVHLGREDFPVKEARKIAPRMIIGASAYCVKDVLQAKKDGADYFGIAPVFATKTKKVKEKPIGVAGVKKIAYIKGVLPFTAMGGITEKNVRSVIEAGAPSVAIISDITMSRNPEEKVRRILNIIKKRSKK